MGATTRRFAGESLRPLDERETIDSEDIPGGVGVERARLELQRNPGVLHVRVRSPEESWDVMVRDDRSVRVVDPRGRTDREIPEWVRTLLDQYQTNPPINWREL